MARVRNPLIDPTEKGLQLLRERCGLIKSKTGDGKRRLESKARNYALYSEYKEQKKSTPSLSYNAYAAGKIKNGYEELSRPSIIRIIAALHEAENGTKN